MLRERGADFWLKECGETSCRSEYWTWALKIGENSAGRSSVAERVGVCDECGAGPRSPRWLCRAVLPPPGGASAA